LRPIQLLLLVLLAAGVAVYFRRFQSRLRDRLLVLAIVSGGAVLVFVPGWSIGIAHRLGVGRGVDLVIYLALVAICFVGIMLYSHVRTLEERLVRVTRALAIVTARSPETGPERTRDEPDAG
jgi:hypothetical protein